MTRPATHILHVFATFATGGPQVRAAEIMQVMSDSARHTIIAMDGRSDCAERLAGVQHEIVAPPSARGFFAMGKAMAAALRDLRPDLLLTYNWGAIESLLGARFARHRAVLHHEEGFGREESQRFLKRRIWMRRFLLGQAHRVIVPSHVLERIALDLWKQPRTRVCYLPNGVDLARFTPRPAASRENEREIVVGSVAHFRPEKNQPLLVRAFAACRHKERANLLLVGEGPELEATRQTAEELGVADRVRFAGPAADTAPLYQEMDVFALSSRTEQMPLVVLEAMASGLPVASTDVGDVREMVDESNRPHIAPKNDPAALAAALDALIEDTDARRRIGAANRKRCEEHYETRSCLQAHLDLYEQAIQAGRA